MSEAYAAVGNRLEERIFQLIPEHPEILEMEDVWDLFKIKEFDCQDLAPSLFQASWALAHARKRYEATRNGGEVQ